MLSALSAHTLRVVYFLFSYADPLPPLAVLFADHTLPLSFSYTSLLLMIPRSRIKETCVRVIRRLHLTLFFTCINEATHI